LADKNRASHPRIPQASGPDAGPPLSHAAVARAFLDESVQLVDARLKQYLPGEDVVPATLHKAMRYSIFAGGKRLRPALVLAAARAVGGSDEDALPAACAVEMLHTYSLVHDDLPAMDDDDLRRGRPTCHKVFGEAMAILAGDALLTYAFEVLTINARPEKAAALVRAVARGVGTFGMVGGQVLDMEGEGQSATVDSVRAIHNWKTAALIRACCEAGALCANADETQAAHLAEYGQNIGLAFQIVDDILDLTSTPEQLGKTPGKDAKTGKATFPAVMGMEESKREAARLAGIAFDALTIFGPKAATLESLGRFVLERQS
jgi:geranylgeranyl diphosphate synthase type II